MLVAQFAFDAHAEIQRLGRRIGLLHDAAHVVARIGIVAFSVGKKRQVVACHQVVGGDHQRSFVEIFCALGFTDRCGTFTRVGQRNIRRAIQRVAYRLFEFRDRFLFAAVGAKVPAPVLPYFRIVGCQLDRFEKTLLRVGILAEHGIDEAIYVVNLGIARIQFDRFAQLLQCNIHLSAFEITGGDLGVQLRTLRRRRFLQRWRQGRCRRHRRRHRSCR